MNLAKAWGLFLTFLLYTTFLSSQSIFINEFMASNDQTIADENGEFDDWVEIYNAGDTPFDLGGKYITDDFSEPNQWQIPTTNPTLTTIPAGGYLLIWLDGDEEQGVLHVAPKLGASGEQIGIYDSDGITPLDTLTFGEQKKDVSEGRSPDGSNNFLKFNTPSPNESNGLPAPEEVAKPLFSQNGGLYNSSFILTLNSTTDNAIIHYTTNGSEPSENSPIYNNPISINTSQVIRAKAFNTGGIASETVTHSYFINTNHTFPIVSISGDSSVFFDLETGLFPNYEEDIEVPLNIEFYEPDGTIGFNQVAEVEIHGSASARLNQKSLAIKAKGSLGNSTINYQIFPNKERTEYRSLILRNSGQDWEYTMFRDALESDLVNNLNNLPVLIEQPNLDDQAYRPVIAYLNGEYWGIYNLRERSDKRYIKTHYDLDDDEIDLIENLDDAKEGDFLAWNQFDSLLRSKSFTDESGLNELATLADVDNYRDYLIHNIFIDNTDWPGNNFLRWRPKAADGKWRWLTKDLDYGFGYLELDTENFNTGNPNVNSLDRLLNPTFFFPNPEWATLLFNKLMENPNWKTAFINRMADQLNVLFSKERMLAKIDEFQTTYQPEIDQHNQKWQNVWTWNQDVEVLRTFANGRTTAVRNHFIESIPEISGTSSVALNSLPNEGGTIKISTVSTTLENTNWVGTYFNGIEIPLQAMPNEGYKFVGWSANVNSNEENAVVILNGDVAITAIFAPDSLSNEPLNQVINFPEISDKNIFDTPFSINVSATSGLPVELTLVSGPATLDGNIVTLDGIEGTVFIQASQAGNETFNAATTVSRLFEVTNDTIVPPMNNEYCLAEGKSPWEEYIANVQFRNIDNSSGKDKYGNFLDQNATVSLGENYPISLTPEFSWAHHEEVFRVWIDWNQDADFEDVNEQVYRGNLPAGINGTPASPLVGIITIPENASLGITRMRVSMQRNQAAEPCGNFDFGEIEDYSITVVAGEIINLEINCLTPISANAVLGENGAIVEWETPSTNTDCPEGINTISQTSGLPSGSFFPVGSSLIEYTATDNCGNMTTCNFEIKVNANGTYCQSQGNQPWQEYIENVQLNTIDNSSFKEKYEDFTNLTTILEKGIEYEVRLTPGFSFFQWDEAFQVWIDFDGNGSFAEDGELVYSGTYAAQTQNTSPEPLVGTFTIPNFAQTINTRMRVSMQRNEPANACAVFEFGEVEDYSLEIVDGNSNNSRTSYLNFVAFNQGRAVETQWLTNKLAEIEYLTLERSANGIDFATLKYFKHFDNKKEDAFFKEIDSKPLMGENFYRLKQQFKDGQVAFSPIQMVKFQVDLGSVTIFPNPAKDVLNIQLNKFTGKAGKIELLDAYGRLQKSLNVAILPNSLLSIPLQGMVDGLYYLSISVEGQKRIDKKVLVQRFY